MGGRCILLYWIEKRCSHEIWTWIKYVMRCWSSLLSMLAVQCGMNGPLLHCVSVCWVKYAGKTNEIKCAVAIKCFLPALGKMKVLFCFISWRGALILVFSLGKEMFMDSLRGRERSRNLLWRVVYFSEGKVNKDSLGATENATQSSGHLIKPALLSFCLCLL